MSAVARLGDKSQVPADAHGCVSCAHPAEGPATSGSPDVFVNGKAAVRVGDVGVHAACCGPNTWTAKMGSDSVFVNGKPLHRLGDMDQHCGGVGKMIQGSPDVIAGGGQTSTGKSAEIMESPDAGHRFQAVFEDSEGRPIANLPVVVTLPSGEERKMRTDGSGRITVHGVDEGQCDVRVGDAWMVPKG